MKAQELLMYLLCFNLAITIIGYIGLFITVSSISIFGLTLGWIVALIVGAVLGSAVVNYVSGGKTQQSTQGVIYNVFATTYIATFLQVILIFTSIGYLLDSFDSSHKLLAFYTIVIGAFTVLSAWAFLTGISQMITGGWRQMK